MVDKLTPLETFFKTYENGEVCGPYRTPEGDVVKGCTKTEADGSGVPPGYRDMAPFYPEPPSAKYTAMVAGLKKVPEGAFSRIELAPPKAFVTTALQREAALRRDYLHHRMKEASVKYRRFRLLTGTKAMRRGWEMRNKKPYEQGLSEVEDRLAKAEAAYKKIGGKVDPERNRRK